MDQAQTIQRLKDAQELPFATIEDLTYVPKDISTEVLQEYLKRFTKPTGKCWLCENDLYVTWGLVHGVAHCTNCGIDCMVYHYIEDENGKKQKIERTLQYHPSNYGVDDDEE